MQLSYLVVVASRVFLDGGVDYGGIDYIQPIASTLVWIQLLYFVFEMGYIKDTIAS
jgi:hypothetical protein